ncbi:hypothetical protein LSAT2_025097 [Lamellibrachia satsuma]|nr:hypothetical protein LSAT2_025097 [Lamellibrachia satsuma]
MSDTFQTEDEFNSTTASSSIASPEPMNTASGRDASNAHTPAPASSSTIRSKKRRKCDKNDMECALTELIKETTKSKQNLDKQVMGCLQKDADDVFYESCALRSKKLPATTQSFLQLQVSQLFFNAENPLMLPVQITPVPPAQLVPAPGPSHVLAHSQQLVYEHTDGSSEQLMLYNQVPQV